MASAMVVMARQERVMASVDIENIMVALGTVAGSPMGEQEEMQLLLVPVGAASRFVKPMVGLPFTHVKAGF